jgi:hypothetical protein
LKPVDPQDFKAPFIDRPQIWREADAFRDRYWPSEKIPVDVRAIVEFELGLEIRPVSRMREEEDIDALLLGNWRTLMVDLRHYMDDRYLNRLRFSVAHELGHYVLHKSIFDQMPRGSIDEWVRFALELPDKEYSFLEYHAYEFAGRLLVPSATLASEFEAVMAQVERSGLKRSELRDESHLGYLVKPIAAKFGVSSEVIERRLTKEGLWPLV